ncbi:hypothetical protein yc1106_09193 [Curvularia clavata]|uniref:Xylanolytic transcriptional activator regulatory domain-containing protein n=1 Tax=Curvularia clavata TaxID=95742 RepID=A0A9Q8ZI67_CURCL|nr:hypothetical protein yc1106_09193 [Curvularia clavata]
MDTSSRRPRAPRKPSARSQASTALPTATDPDCNQDATTKQFPYMMHDVQAQNNGLFVFTDPTLPQGQLDLTGYEDFMSFPYPVSTGGEAMDGTTSSHLFTSISSLDVQVNDPQFSPHGPGSSGLYKNPQEFLQGPIHPPTPPFTSPQIMQSVSASLNNESNTSSPRKLTQDIPMSNLDAPDDVLGKLVDLLARPDAWNGLNGYQSNANVAMSQDARDRIVATVQLLLHRALEAGCSTASSSQGLFGRIVSLPPSHVLMHFVDIYAARIDSIQPYLGLPGSPTANIQDILQIDAADIGMLLIILLIAHGAMLTDHHESHIFAHGLIEYAMSKRGQFLSPLKCSSILQPEQEIHDPFLNGRNHWEKWKEIETRNRHAYAWVYVDLEISLLHDVAPILSVNDLQISLPHCNNLWHAQSCNDWIEQYEASGIHVGHKMPSLNGLFRSFLQGRLTSSDDVPLHHLRLLLHPLQAMVLEQQQLLRIFDVDEPSNRYRVLSKIKVLGRMQETQDLVQDLAMFVNRHTQAAMDDNIKGSTNSIDWTSLIMLHMVSLNVCASIPDIEKCGKEEPPLSPIAREDMWRRLRYPEGENYVLFHAGQIFRIIDNLPVGARPMWWPVAIYRASLACWSLRAVERLVPSSPTHEVGIDTLLPGDETRSLNAAAVTPVVTLPGNRRLPILEGGNSLLYCISKLENHPTHLVSNVLEKARYYLHRWN